MNTKIEEIKRITDSFDTLTSEEKNTLNTYLLNNIDSFNNDPTATIKNGLRFLAEQLVRKFIKETNDRTSESLENLHESTDKTDGYAKTINDSQRIERGKAFVETMSSQARMQDELIQHRREEMYIDKKIDFNAESIPVNDYVEPVEESNNLIYNKPIVDYNKPIVDYNEPITIQQEQHFDKITDQNKYEQIKLRQSEIETEIKQSLAELPQEAKYSIVQLREYRRKMATQVNPKVFTDEIEIAARYLQKLDQLLLGKIREQAALAMQTTTLGHNLTSREQAYVNYSDLLYYSKLEDLSLVYAMFYSEFPTEDFGTYAMTKLDEMKQAENQPPKMK